MSRIEYSSSANVNFDIVKNGSQGNDTIKLSNDIAGSVTANKGDDSLHMTGNLQSGSVYGGKGQDLFDIRNTTIKNSLNSMVNGNKGNDQFTFSGNVKAESGIATFHGGKGDDVFTVKEDFSGIIKVNGDKDNNQLVLRGAWKDAQTDGQGTYYEKVDNGARVYVENIGQVIKNTPAEVFTQFDGLYLSKNPGVVSNAEQHYLKYGWAENRPGAMQVFSEELYLRANPDVAADVSSGKYKNGLQHYMNKGYLENRAGLPVITNFNEQTYLKFNPEVKQAVQEGRLKSGLEHYVLHGAKEGRLGTPVMFDEKYYLSQYPEIAQAISKGEIASAQEHFEKFGQAEARKPSADPEAKLTTVLVVTTQTPEIPEAINETAEEVRPTRPFVAFEQRPLGESTQKGVEDTILTGDVVDTGELVRINGHRRKSDNFFIKDFTGKIMIDGGRKDGYRNNIYLDGPLYFTQGLEASRTGPFYRSKKDAETETNPISAQELNATGKFWVHTGDKVEGLDNFVRNSLAQYETPGSEPTAIIALNRIIDIYAADGKRFERAKMQPASMTFGQIATTAARTIIGVASLFAGPAAAPFLAGANLGLGTYEALKDGKVNFQEVLGVGADSLGFAAAISSPAVASQFSTVQKGLSITNNAISFVNNPTATGAFGIGSQLAGVTGNPLTSANLGFAGSVTNLLENGITPNALIDTVTSGFALKNEINKKLEQDRITNQPAVNPFDINRVNIDQVNFSFAPSNNILVEPFKLSPNPIFDEALNSPGLTTPIESGYVSDDVTFGGIEEDNFPDNLVAGTPSKPKLKPPDPAFPGQNVSNILSRNQLSDQRISPVPNEVTRQKYPNTAFNSIELANGYLLEDAPRVLRTMFADGRVQYNITGLTTGEGPINTGDAVAYNEEPLIGTHRSSAVQAIQRDIERLRRAGYDVDPNNITIKAHSLGVYDAIRLGLDGRTNNLVIFGLPHLAIQKLEPSRFFPEKEVEAFRERARIEAYIGLNDAISGIHGQYFGLGVHNEGTITTEKPLNFRVVDTGPAGITQGLTAHARRNFLRAAPLTNFLQPF
ncbi:MAG: hypothetical protein JNN15_12270 [Blastocatellia bacterium]|nr:hypothetical protein [Blastocatellia bacterium]